MTEPISFMQRAFELAQYANSIDEVPVGAVVVKDGKIIGEGFNQPILSEDPCAHAEIVALRSAGSASKNYRLIDCDLYVTLEPCIMCVGAMIHARIKRLFFATFEPKTGAVSSCFQLLDNKQLNHQITWHQGLMKEECAELLSDFFKKRRQSAQSNQ